MKEAIGYLRVGMAEQGRSGLGLAEQRLEIEAFGAREGFQVKSWHQDVQTGAGKDALRLRSGLAKAHTEAKSRGCPLILAKLDRLSRNVLHIWAYLAEQERKVSSARVRAALAEAKAPGPKAGPAAR